MTLCRHQQGGENTSRPDETQFSVYPLKEAPKREFRQTCTTFPQFPPPPSSNNLNSAASRFTVLDYPAANGKWQMASVAAAAVNVFRDSLKETTIPSTLLCSTLWLPRSGGLSVGRRRQRTLLKFMVFVVSSEREGGRRE